MWSAVLCPVAPSSQRCERPRLGVEAFMAVGAEPTRGPGTPAAHCGGPPSVPVVCLFWTPHATEPCSSRSFVSASGLHCVPLHTGVRAHPHVHIRTPAHPHTCAPAHMHTLTPALPHTCTSAHLHTCTPAHLRTCTRAHLRTRTSAHPHTCTPAHPHTCAPAHLRRCPALSKPDPHSCVRGEVSSGCSVRQ